MIDPGSAPKATNAPSGGYYTPSMLLGAALRRTTARINFHPHGVASERAMRTQPIDRTQRTAAAGEAGVAMLDAKASSVMSEEAFAAWLAPFGLSQDDLLQCLELGQVARDRRKAESAEREESFRRIVKERRDQMSPEAVRREEEQWARPSERGQQELRR